MSASTERISPAEPIIRASPRWPWGRWGLRATAISYLALMIVLPLSAILVSGLSGGLTAFWGEITNQIAFSALKLTLLTAVLTTLITS